MLNEKVNMVDPKPVIRAAIKELMKREKISLTTLSSGTGISKSNLSQVLSGKKSSSIDNLVRIAAGLGINVKVIITVEQKACSTLPKWKPKHV